MGDCGSRRGERRLSRAESAQDQVVLLPVGRARGALALRPRHAATHSREFPGPRAVTFRRPGDRMTLPRWLGPGALAFLAIWLALMVVGRSGMLRDPGTFWHTTTGEIILKEGFIRYDPYTFSFSGSWWVPFQWLGEVGMALAHR